MDGLSEQEILDVWDTGQGQHPVDRALTLLGPAHPEFNRQQLAALGIGVRDELLLRLRQTTFGRRLAAVVQCPSCAAELEITTDAAQLRALENPVEDHGTIDASGVHVDYRAPDSYDLAAAAVATGSEAATCILLSRCVVSATRGGQQLAVESLSAEVVEAVEEAMIRLSPPLERQFSQSCPDCGHQWSAALDIASFLWAELDSAARRLIREVATLARAYNWTEGDVLSLSPQRRSSYLELAYE